MTDFSSLALLSSDERGKPKGKAKAKSKAKAKATAQTSNSAAANQVVFTPNFAEQPIQEIEKPVKATRKKDPELEKLDLRRKLLLLGAKWRSRVEELNAETTMVIGQASDYPDCADLINIVKLRLERLCALLPPGQTCEFPDGSTAAEFTDESCRDKLSPISSSKRKALEAPTKACLTEYDKSMNSAEQALQKAIALLNKTFTELQVAAEREKAKEERLRQIREKKAKEAIDAVKKARADGELDADTEMNRTGEANEDEEEDGDDNKSQASSSDSDAESNLSDDNKDNMNSDDDGAGAHAQSDAKKPDKVAAKSNAKKPGNVAAKSNAMPVELDVVRDDKSGLDSVGVMSV